MHSIQRFLAAFSHAAKPICTTSFISMLVGMSFTFVCQQMAELVFNSGARVVCFMALCYGVTIWVMTGSCVAAVEGDPKLPLGLRPLYYAPGTYLPYWRQTKWRMYGLLLFPVLFSSLSMLGSEHFWWIFVSIQLMGWAMWWAGWYRLFDAPSRSRF